MMTVAATSLQVCDACGSAVGELDPAAACRSCGGLFELRHSVTVGAGAFRSLTRERRAAMRGPDASGVWRYRELILPSAGPEEIVSHGEGNTPLLESRAVSTRAGFARADQLLIKHEGENPTGSFKDRGMTVAITQARRAGAIAVACASTGNTSASLAAYAARAELPALVFVPQGKVAGGKLAQTIAYGARTLFVRGGFDECLALARSASAELGIALLNSVNPFRIEGQKTIVLELLEQLDWNPPDWIALPAGNLGNTSAFGKALREAHHMGLISRVPRLCAVQAAGAAPFAQSFSGGFAERIAVKPETVATAIRIGAPASWDRAVRAIRETNGVVTAVGDDEILEAKAAIDAAGIGCEPASAASVAGIARLRRDGTIAASDTVCAVLTGHVLKDPEAVIEFHRHADPRRPGANPPMEIEARVADVERILNEMR